LPPEPPPNPAPQSAGEAVVAVGYQLIKEYDIGAGRSAIESSVTASAGGTLGSTLVTAFTGALARRRPAARTHVIAAAAIALPRPAFVTVTVSTATPSCAPTGGHRLV
jgi:hypothetical protein